MRGCREALSLNREIHKDVVDFEFQVLLKLLGRSKQPKSCFVFLSFLLQVGEHLVRYVRLIEQGDAVGFGQELLRHLGKHSSATLVDDYQFTSDTHTSLITVDRSSRNQNPDLQSCVNKFKSIISASKQSEKLFPGVTLIFSTRGIAGDITLSHNINSTFFDRVENAFKLHPPTSFNLCRNFLRLHISGKHSNLSLSEQLKLLNCLEPKFIHFPYIQGGLTWNSKSIKQGVLDHAIDDVMLMQSRHTNLSHSKVRENAHSLGRNFTNHGKSNTSLSSLKSQFVCIGFLRLLVRNQSQVSVVWNGYDASSGEFLEMRKMIPPPPDQSIIPKS